MNGRQVRRRDGRVWRHAIAAVLGCVTVSLAVRPAAAAPPIGACLVYGAAVCATEVDPPAGLDRIDQRTLPLDRRFAYNFNGAGVQVYVLDAGVDPTVAELEGRATIENSRADGVRDHRTCLHATRIAEIIAGRVNGVAKQVQIHSVKIGGCVNNDLSTTTPQIVEGLDWVRQHAVRPAVANLSFGSKQTDPIVLDAVKRLVDSGVYVVIAAGQDGVDACTVTPAQYAPAMTVGATTLSDHVLTGSNRGKCIDLFAPGSLLIDGSFADGSSYAAPFVAGVAALYLQRDGAMTQADLNKLLVSGATTGVLENLPSADSPNRLLYGRVKPRPPVLAPP